MKPLLTLEEARHLLGDPCSRTAFYDAARRGDIPSIRLGRRLFVPTAKLYEMLGVGTTLGPSGSVSPRTKADERSDLSDEAAGESALQ